MPPDASGQYYFESRDQLIQEAFDQHARHVIEVVRLADDPLATPWDRLTALLEAAVLRRDLRQSAALWMEFTSASLHDTELRAGQGDVRGLAGAAGADR